MVLPDPAGPVTSSGELRWAITFCCAEQDAEIRQLLLEDAKLEKENPGSTDWHQKEVCTVSLLRHLHLTSDHLKLKMQLSGRFAQLVHLPYGDLD